MQIDDKGDSEGRFKLHSDIFPKPLGKRSDIVFNSASSKPNSVALKEIGPIQTTISIHKTFRNSKLIQEITLYHTLPRIDCCLKMDWHETQQMIKLIFPLALKNPKILYSTPYGSIPREADGLEYPMLRWVDLSTETYGTAILNNARNAADVKGSTIGISVLRSPITPMPNSDQGAHYFSYSIFPYVKTGFSTAQVIREADGFNIPLIAIQIMPHEGRLPHSCSFLEMSALNVNIEVLKKAYDSNDWILRLYETQGISVETTILVSNFTIHKAYETDMLENNGSLISFDAHSISIKMTPYEIKTLKIIVQ